MYRVLHKGHVLHSKEYGPVKRRNSFTVSCDKDNIQILCFVQCSTTSGYQYGAIARELVAVPNQSKFCPHITPVVLGDTKVIKLQDIQELTMFIDIGAGKTYVAEFPNFWEKD